MLQSLLAIVGVLLVLGAAGFAVIGLGLRAKSPIVLGALIWVAKHGMNRRQMRTAGTPGAYAGIIRARGRVSGRMIETPVGIIADGDAFLIALPYGPRPQWLRNVFAAGEATLVHEGATYAVDRPEMVPTASVARLFSATDQRLFRILRVDECLRLRRADAQELGTAAA